MDMDDITGIVQDATIKEANVEYILKSSHITPFGEYYKSKNPNIIPLHENMHAYFVKYDDGWRLRK